MATRKQNIIINQVVVSQTVRESLDISHWRNALKSAESLYNPNRTQLYDIYSDVLLDAHLGAVIMKRKAVLLNSPILFSRDGDEDETITLQIESPWFRRFISDLLDTIYWGFTVFQFYRQGEWLGYDLIPRKHIRPEKGMLVKNQFDPTGISYREGGYPNIMEAGQAHDLGLLCKAAPYVIYKRNGLADYAQFAELFGQPIREGTYDAFDDQAREKLKADMEQMGSSAIFIHPENTQIKLIESQQKTGGSGLYKDLISACNAEISKLILGNTLTTEQGERGARSLGEVHQDSEDELVKSDKRFVLDTLNYDLADIFANLGIDTTGGEFLFADKPRISLKEKFDIDILLADRIPVSDDYLYETYGIPRPDNYDELKKEIVERKKEPQPLFQPSNKGRFFDFF